MITFFLSELQVWPRYEKYSIFHELFEKQHRVTPKRKKKATKATFEVKTSERRWKALWRCAPKIRRYMRLNRHLRLETWSFGHYLENGQTDFGDNVSNDFGEILNFWVFAIFFGSKNRLKMPNFVKKLQNRKIDSIANFASNLSPEGKNIFFEQFLWYPATSWYP